MNKLLDEMKELLRLTKPEFVNRAHFKSKLYRLCGDNAEDIIELLEASQEMSIATTSLAKNLATPRLRLAVETFTGEQNCKCMGTRSYKDGICDRCGLKEKE